MRAFYNDTSTRSNASAIARCKAYEGGKVIPWRTIAEDWEIGGGRKMDCAAALIIASGETSCIAAGCDSVQAGIWQVTSPDLPGPSGCPDGSTNPCCTVDYVRNHFNTNVPSAKKTTSGNIGCMGSFRDGNGWSGDPRNPSRKMPASRPLNASQVVGAIVPTDHSGGSLGGTQSNWIGPFCHQGGFSCDTKDPYCHSKAQKGLSGDNWGGGSEWSGAGAGAQIFPFPYYYYARFVESQGNGKGMTGKMHCKTTGAEAGCGAVPSEKVLDCAQPSNGKVPTGEVQQCLNRITDLAIQLATGICTQSTLEVLV